MRYFSHLNTAIEIIQQFTGQEPLHHFLKIFFGHQKKFGSKDRKRISHLCYVFYRVGQMMPTHRSMNSGPTIIQQNILTGLFLCHYESDELLQALKPAWNKSIGLPVSEKISLLEKEQGMGKTIGLESIFPWIDQLSEGIDQSIFSYSHLQQPDLFIRIRPGFEKAVIEKMQKQAIVFEWIAPSAVRLPNGFKVTDLFETDKEMIVQDLSSQRIGEFMQDFNDRSVPASSAMAALSIWDCCAASGGKSILANDVIGNMNLTVSDVWESILVNLKKRFAKAGIHQYHSFQIDLAQATRPFNLNFSKNSVQQSAPTTPHSPFDLIIADLPCTGSGTWGRTPEQGYFFDLAVINKYVELQKKILTNIIPQLKKTGKLLYITCSVFKKENEDIVEYLQEHFSLKLEKMKLLKGYEEKADTMFAALLSAL